MHTIIMWVVVEHLLLDQKKKKKKKKREGEIEVKVMGERKEEWKRRKRVFVCVKEKR